MSMSMWAYMHMYFEYKVIFRTSSHFLGMMIWPIAKKWGAAEVKS